MLLYFCKAYEICKMFCLKHNFVKPTLYIRFKSPLNMLTELRPDKNLLDPNFNGYKLSLDPITVYRQNITEGVDHVSQSEDQFSFIHTKIFSLHNHLFSDPWHDNSVFFIDKYWKLRRATVIPETGRVEGLKTVWTVPNLTQRENGHFNTSLLFPSRESAVLSDGCGQLYLLSQADPSNWQLELSVPIAVSLLISARLVADSALHCVLMALDTLNTEEANCEAAAGKPKPPTVNTVLHWITFTKEGGGWNVSCTRRLEGAGSVDYVALESTCSALYIVSNASFKFTENSANPVPPPEEKMEAEKQKTLYSWQQTSDDVKIVVEVDKNTTRDDIEVVVNERELMIRCRQQMIVTGALSQVVDTDLTTWTLQPDRLEVTLSKRDVGLMWPELVPGDLRGRQVLNPAVVEEIHSRLSHLCSDTEVQDTGEGYAPTFNLDQLEECDSAPEDSHMLARLDSSTNNITHQVSLAGHQWLMAVAQNTDCAPSICVRHDVDGCVWRLDPPPSPSPSTWPCQHIGTFYALGYVAASKQQKKFIIAAPDLSYSVICEASSHVFVYRTATTVDGELRNRKTAAKIATVAKQQLINLESAAPVLGAHASHSHLFILTSDTLFTFHIQ